MSAERSDWTQLNHATGSSALAIADKPLGFNQFRPARELQPGSKVFAHLALYTSRHD